MSTGGMYMYICMYIQDSSQCADAKKLVIFWDVGGGVGRTIIDHLEFVSE